MPACTGGATTSISGVVYDPAGKNPLYDAYVFVPWDVANLPAIARGTHTCGTCDVPIGSYVAATKTDVTGAFTLTGVPAGSAVPVAVQVGKWRRVVTVNVPNACGANAIAGATLRLPQSSAEGNLPQMALLTGGCEDLGCFLVDIGIASSEFSAPHAGGRVDVYQGASAGVSSGAPSLSNGTAGNCTTTSCPLWSSKSSLEAYDMVLLSCECAEGTSTNETAAGYTSMRDWLNEGGKLLASHYNYTWFKNNPDTQLAGVATWLGSSIAAGSGTYDLDTTFPKGTAFGQWLGNASALASSGPPPAVSLSSVASSVSSVNAATTRRWVYDPSTSPVDTKYLSFTTPVAPSEGGAPVSACGKAAFTDMHSTSSLLATATSIPAGCTASNLTAQQKALEFLFFDLSGCVADDTQPPPPPPPSQ
jgi:hypothetical protein